jgi:hypothetical protein
MRLSPMKHSLEDFKDVSEVILHDNNKLIQKVQFVFDKIVTDKDEKIYHLKEHSKKLLA